MLFDTGCHRKNVRIENNIFRRKADFVHQQVVGASANLLAPLQRIGLTFFVERHDDGCRAVAARELGLADEFRLAFFHADRIHDRLALNTLQAGLDDFPLGRIEHGRHAGDVRFGGNQVHELLHGGGRIQHRLVHVDVDDLRTVLDLLARHRQGLRKLLRYDQARKGARASDVGALSDVYEQRFVADVKRLQPREPQFLLNHRRRSRLDVLKAFRNFTNMRRRGAAATTGNVEKAGLCEFPQKRRGVFRALVILAKRIRQPCVGMQTGMNTSHAG